MRGEVWSIRTACPLEDVDLAGAPCHRYHAGFLARAISVDPHTSGRAPLACHATRRIRVRGRFRHRTVPSTFNYCCLRPALEVCYLRSEANMRHGGRVGGFLTGLSRFKTPVQIHDPNERNRASTSHDGRRAAFQRARPCSLSPHQDLFALRQHAGEARASNRYIRGIVPAAGTVQALHVPFLSQTFLRLFVGKPYHQTRFPVACNNGGTRAGALDGLANRGIPHRNEADPAAGPGGMNPECLRRLGKPRYRPGSTDRHRPCNFSEKY